MNKDLGAESTFLALQNPRIIESCWSNKEATILVYQNRTNNNHDFKDKDKDEAKANAKDGCSTAVSVTLQPTWMKTKENILQKRKKLKTSNKLNPHNYSGPNANVFQQKFEYPPSEEDKLKNNKINKEGNLFPTKMMIPPGKVIKKCKCGNVFRVVSLESRNPVIHHSKPTNDSRTGNLTPHFVVS